MRTGCYGKQPASPSIVAHRRSTRGAASSAHDGQEEPRDEQHERPSAGRGSAACLRKLWEEKRARRTFGSGYEKGTTITPAPASSCAISRRGRQLLRRATRAAATGLFFSSVRVRNRRSLHHRRRRGLAPPPPAQARGRVGRKGESETEDYPTGGLPGVRHHQGAHKLLGGSSLRRISSRFNAMIR